ncbi:MAG: metal-dependent hydrolase, partial [Aliifodinibius sp.]|nr:metal-dependent hydrolase [Fodinibius sp.]NIV16147.1 metal-dependent hydrolase [Fodinibius sp.]NIY30126.1 metal-dependent hydrolase [Fodinibius sp.]
MDVTEEELKKEGDQIVIQKLDQKIAQSRYVDQAIVLAIDGVINQQGEVDRELTQVYVPNDYIQREVTKYPRLLFGASINPNRE